MSRATSKKQVTTSTPSWHKDTSKNTKRSTSPKEFTIDPWKSIIVENVPYKCTTSDLETHLKKELEIAKVYIVHTDEKKRCQTAIVQLDSTQQRYNAMGKLGGKTVMGGVTLTFKKFSRSSGHSHTIKIGDAGSWKKPTVTRRRSGFDKKRRRRRSKKYTGDSDASSSLNSRSDASSSFKSTSSEESSTKENAGVVKVEAKKPLQKTPGVDRSDIAKLMEECRLLMEQNSLGSRNKKDSPKLEKQSSDKSEGRSSFMKSIGLS